MALLTYMDKSDRYLKCRPDVYIYILMFKLYDKSNMDRYTENKTENKYMLKQHR